MTKLKTVYEQAVSLSNMGYGSTDVTRVADTLREDRANTLAVLREGVERIAQTKETGMSDFPEDHEWTVDYHELLDLLQETLGEK